jgi:hypothetical protein
VTGEVARPPVVFFTAIFVVAVFIDASYVEAVDKRVNLPVSEITENR